jgi:hypothetical protein
MIASQGTYCPKNGPRRKKAMKNDNPWTGDRAGRYVGSCGCTALIIYLVVTFVAIGGFVIYLAILGLQALGLK